MERPGTHRNRPAPITRRAPVEESPPISSAPTLAPNRLNCSAGVSPANSKGGRPEPNVQARRPRYNLARHRRCRATSDSSLIGVNWLSRGRVGAGGGALACVDGFAEAGGPVVGERWVDKRGLPPLLERVGFAVVVGEEYGASQCFSCVLFCFLCVFFGDLFFVGRDVFKLVGIRSGFGFSAVSSASLVKVPVGISGCALGE